PVFAQPVAPQPVFAQPIAAQPVYSQPVAPQPVFAPQPQAPVMYVPMVPQAQPQAPQPQVPQPEVPQPKSPDSANDCNRALQRVTAQMESLTKVVETHTVVLPSHDERLQALEKWAKTVNKPDALGKFPEYKAPSDDKIPLPTEKKDK